MRLSSPYSMPQPARLHLCGVCFAAGPRRTSKSLKRHYGSSSPGPIWNGLFGMGTPDPEAVLLAVGETALMCSCVAMLHARPFHAPQSALNFRIETQSQLGASDPGRRPQGAPLPKQEPSSWI